MRLPGGETTSRGLACSASLAEPWSDTCPLSSPSVSGRLVSAEFRLPNLLPMVFACLGFQWAATNEPHPNHFELNVNSQLSLVTLCNRQLVEKCLYCHSGE